MLDNQKFFAQGWVEDGNHILSIERWIPRSEGYFWVCKDPSNYPIERFLLADEANSPTSDVARDPFRTQTIDPQKLTHPRRSS